jgi:hypothetical protein
MLVAGAQRWSLSSSRQWTGNGAQPGATEMVKRNLESKKPTLIKDLNSYCAERAWNIVMFLFAQAAFHQP